MANWDRAGRYLSFATTGVVAWFGTDFRRWRERGLTPLWLVFSARQATEVRKALEPWAAQHGLPSSVGADGSFGVGIDLTPEQEQDEVVSSLVKRLESVAVEVARVPAKPEQQEMHEEAAVSEAKGKLVLAG